MRGMIASLLVVSLSVAAAGCARKKAVTPEEAAKSLASLLCEKYAGCQQNPDFNKDQCLQEIGNGLTERLKAKADLKVESGMLEGCKKTITGSGCEVLSSDAPPAGCEFLQ